MRKPHNNYIYYWIQHPGHATTELFHENIAFLLIQNAKGKIDGKMKQLLTGLDDGLSSQTEARKSVPLCNTGFE